MKNLKTFERYIAASEPSFPTTTGSKINIHRIKRRVEDILEDLYEEGKLDDLISQINFNIDEDKAVAELTHRLRDLIPTNEGGLYDFFGQLSVRLANRVSAMDDGEKEKAIIMIGLSFSAVLGLSYLAVKKLLPLILMKMSELVAEHPFKAWLLILTPIILGYIFRKRDGGGGGHHGGNIFGDVEEIR